MMSHGRQRATARGCHTACAPSAHLFGWAFGGKGRIVESGEPPHSDSPLLVATHRLPFSLRRTERGLERRPGPGGLVAALEPVLGKRGGTWLGWPGGELGPDAFAEARGAPYRTAPVPVTPDELQRYHHGFAGDTLWPVFHCLPGRARFDARDWDAYERVNRRFADAALAELEGDELVWIHDHHLMLSPAFLRARRPDAKLAFFLHLPFPPHDVFRSLPRARELLRGLLACDLVGFQVPSYVQNFLDCAERLLGARVVREWRLVEYEDRRITTGDFPIGVDWSHLESLAREAPATAAQGGSRSILGVDRLDYTKGIPERILAVERLLEFEPGLRERIVLLQIAAPSSPGFEQESLQREIDELVGRVNGRFGSASWSPIQYVHRSLDHECLAGLYRDADVALITPLRDGMNLVAKEFVACQTADPGVLVLSEMAGAAESMPEALLVNPHDVEETARTLHRALGMEEPERRGRMAALRARERRQDVHTWSEGFLRAYHAGRQRRKPGGPGAI